MDYFCALQRLVDDYHDDKEKLMKGVILVTIFERTQSSYIWPAVKSTFKSEISFSSSTGRRELSCVNNHCTLHVKIKPSNWKVIKGTIGSGAWFINDEARKENICDFLFYIEYIFERRKIITF
jgi:hypothetical protein